MTSGSAIVNAATIAGGAKRFGIDTGYDEVEWFGAVTGGYGARVRPGCSVTVAKIGSIRDAGRKSMRGEALAATGFVARGAAFAGAIGDGPDWTRGGGDCVRGSADLFIKSLDSSTARAGRSGVTRRVPAEIGVRSIVVAFGGIESAVSVAGANGRWGSTRTSGRTAGDPATAMDPCD